MDIQKLYQLGFLFPVSAGIQIDINAVRRKDGSEGSTCDHNCTREVGDYDCPAAFTLNKGMNRRFAPKAQILSWISAAAQALVEARLRFVKDDEGYFDENQIPQVLRQPISNALVEGGTEVNLFGGNPEMHPEISEIISEGVSRGYQMNLTTTGRRFIKESAFIGRTAQNPPHLIALSADNIAPEKLEQVLGLGLDGLRDAWKGVDPLNGQEQKFLEGIFTARLFTGRSLPKVLFNMVVHPGNLGHVEELIGRLAEAFPGVLVNPYVAQSSFLHEEPIFGQEYIPELEHFVGRMINWSKDPSSPITKRLQYWLVLRAVLDVATPENIPRMLSGYDVWRCYRKPALPYVQIGRGMRGSNDLGAFPGGKLGCFWNDETVSQETPIGSRAQVDGYLLTGMRGRAQESEHPCPGCLMPRLMFNGITTELGLADELRPRYLELRREHAGF